MSVAGDNHVATAGTFSGSTGDLRGVLNHINQNPGSHTISFSLASNTITLGAMLPIINLNAANVITINGDNLGVNIVIDGNNAHRGFFVAQGSVSIQNLHIQNVKASGGSGGGLGDGGGGGGGMGAGAALFVDQAAVTLSNVSMSKAIAQGGNGGSPYSNPVGGAGSGGGGLGGNGGGSQTNLGAAGGGGGLGGAGGSGMNNFTFNGGGGGGGINCGTNYAGTGGEGGSASGSTGGGIGGSGAGAGSNGGGVGGSSGGGGGSGFSGNSSGGNGGGGGINGNNGTLSGGGAGGSGGFGGGGGGGSSGGDGGFGGGGGGIIILDGLSDFSDVGEGIASYGIGGLGGGFGGNSGGGGAGFGGAIFINNGSGHVSGTAGSLIIRGEFTTGSGMNANTTAAGQGADSASSGWAAGNDAFFLTGSSITLDPDGSTITLNSSIADDSPASFAGAPIGVTQGSGAGAVLNIGDVASAAGTVTLVAASTYSGGTNLHKGVLSIQSDSALGSGILTFAQNGTTLQAGANNLILSSPVQLTGDGIIDSNGNTMTIPTVISGNGSLTKIGIGTLIVTGANNYSGGTTVTAGTLQGNTTSLQGDILNNSAVTFNQTAAGTYAGEISGTGSLDKIGTEQLLLSGANTYIGPTTVSAGMLTLNGSLTSSLTTLPGTALNGNGTITGDVVIGGILGPGESIGTFEVVGNITFQTTSTFEVEANPTTADVLDVDASGNITIEPGATISIIPTPATYGVNTIYNIATAGESGGVVVGFFDNVINTYPLITATILYHNSASPILEEASLAFNQISLFLNYLPFSTAVTTGNPGAIAKSLDGFTPPPGSDIALVIQQLYFLPTQEALKVALNQMQPSLLNNISLAQQNSSLFVSSAFTKHTSDLRLTRSPCTKPGDNRWQVWGDGSVDRARQNGNSQNVGFHAKTNLGAGGIDYRITKDFYLGALGAYTHTAINCKDHLANGAANTYYTGLYGSLLYSRFFANLLLVGNFTDYRSKRRVRFDGMDRQPHGHHHGYGAIAHLDLGASLPAQRRAQCYPYGALDYVYQHEKGYTETKAQSLNNNIRARNTSMLRSELGLQGRYCSSIGQDVIIPSAKIGWVYEARFQGKRINARLVDIPNRYTVIGLYPSRSLLAVGASLTGVLYKQTAHLSVTYEGLFGSGYRSDAGNVSLNLRF